MKKNYWIYTFSVPTLPHTQLEYVECLHIESGQYYSTSYLIWGLWDLLGWICVAQIGLDTAHSMMGFRTTMEWVVDLDEVHIANWMKWYNSLETSVSAESPEEIDTDTTTYHHPEVESLVKMEQIDIFVVCSERF